MATIEVIFNGEIKAVSTHQLFALAKRGTITPETKLRVDGKQVQANKIKDIVFGEVPKTKGKEPDIFEIANLNLVSQSVPLPPEAAEWFYADETDQGGPVTQSVIIKLIQAGSLNEDANVWKKDEKIQPLRDNPVFVKYLVQKPKSPSILQKTKETNLVSDPPKNKKGIFVVGFALFVCIILISLTLWNIFRNVWQEYSIQAVINMDMAQLHKAAKQGNAIAQNRLGVIYMTGEKISQNPVKAVEWFRKAAKQGNAFAQTNLGLCLTGDDIRGVGFFYSQVELGHNDLRCFDFFDKESLRSEYGDIFEINLDHEIDPETAIKLFRQAADQGDTVAKVCGQFLFLFLNIVVEDNIGFDNRRKLFNDNIRIFRSAAEQGDPVAAWMLGKCIVRYHNPSHPRNNITEDSQDMLQDIVEKTVPVQEDYATGIKWLRKSAEQGLVNASLLLANEMYMGDNEDFEEAAKWCSLGLKQAQKIKTKLPKGYQKEMENLIGRLENIQQSLKRK